MKSAIIKSILLYPIGFISAAMIYYSSETIYPHGLNAHHVIVGLTILIGIVWLIAATLIYFIKSNKNMLGHILVHGIVAILFALFVLSVIRPWA